MILYITAFRLFFKSSVACVNLYISLTIYISIRLKASTMRKLRTLKQKKKKKLFSRVAKAGLIHTLILREVETEIKRARSFARRFILKVLTGSLV